MPFTSQDYLAAYAQLVAEGDRAGCRRLRAEMARAFAADPRTFADPPQPTAPVSPDVAADLKRTARAAVDWPATQQLRQQKRPTLGGTKTAFRFRDVARRRRVLAAFRAEKELADGLGAHQLPDSEPAD